MFLKSLLALTLLAGVTALNAETLLERSFLSTDDLKGWTLPTGSALSGGDGLKIVSGETGGQSTTVATYQLDIAKVAGRRLELSVESKRELSVPTVKWQGGKFQLSLKSADGKQEWPGVYMAEPVTGWTTLMLSADVPLEVQKCQLALGIQNASGTIYFRNLKVTTGDLMLKLDRQANMGFRDETARDGKGGWSDQGPQNDAGNFKFRNREFANVPFAVADPTRNDGKTIAVLKSSQLPNGLDEVKFDLKSVSHQGGYLYLLHTLTFGYNVKSTVGTIELTGKSGATAKIKVNGGQDVADWWAPSRQPNAYPASLWQNASGGVVGVYVSKFKIPAELGELASLRLIPEDPATMWIIIGATLSGKDYPMPELEKFTVTANDVWRPLPLPEQAGVIAGSALDLSRILVQEPVGTYGRLIIGKDGNFCFADRPEKPVRFLAATYLRGIFKGHAKTPKELVSKAATEEFARQLRMQGFNMIRFHYIDSTMLEGMKEDYQLNPETLDQFDYLIYCMKKEGIYANIDVMASRIGWSHGYSWSAQPDDNRRFKFDIHFSPEVKQNWREGFRVMLTHINPYTNTRLVDDPVLAIAVAFNEQEFGWSSGKNYAPAQPQWRMFLRDRYQTIEALKQTWGESAAGIGSFEQIPDFTAAQILEISPVGADLNRFVNQREDMLADWYVKTARELGFQGYISAYNMGQSLQQSVSRQKCDYIALNSYHAHPFNNAIDKASSIEHKGKYVRAMFAVRQNGKPMVSTEISHAFWSPYRYEEGMMIGAYSAFQGIDGISLYMGSVTAQPQKLPILTFERGHDAVIKANEYQIAFLFRRGDVQRAKSKVLIGIDPETLYPNKVYADALNTEQSLLSLVVGFTTEVGAPHPAKSGELVLPAAGGSSLMLQAIGVAGFAVTKESQAGLFNFDAIIAELKQKGLLPADNRTDHAKGIYESANGEIYLDAAKNLMTVNTPRYQGISAEAKTKVKLDNLEVTELGVRGNLSVMSLQNDKTLADADHMVLIYSTNVLNTNMEFEDKSYRTRLKEGELPLLLETGTFAVTLTNRNADKLKLYALGLDGSRLAALPVKASGCRLEIAIDTAKIPNGPAIYFELVKE